MPRSVSTAHRQRERQRIAQEAARLIRESGINDFDHALRKAATRLGVFDEAGWPRHAQIEEALREQQRLFDPVAQPQALRRRREAAVQAMHFLHAFQPRLAGAVLGGSADGNSPVTLHLHCDDAEAVPHFLHEQGIPATEHSRSMRTGAQRTPGRYPCWEFSADGIAFELVVLPEQALRLPPLSGDDGKPLARASVAQVQRLLVEET